MSPEFYDSSPVQHFEHEGASLALRRFGAGPPLVLVHGFPLHGYTWRHLLPKLAQVRTCWVVDLPGLGDSRWSADADLRFTAQARRLAAWLNAESLTDVAILAHDTGGTIARLAALEVRERIGRIALINTEVPHHRPPWIPLYQALTRLPGAALSFRMLLSLRAYRRSAPGLGGLFADPRLLDGDFHTRFIVPLLRDGQRLRGALRYLQGIEWDRVDALREQHAQLTMPVLLLWGEEDPTFPVAEGERMSEQFPALAGFARIACARLLPHEEQPQAVLASLLPFLRGEARSLVYPPLESSIEASP